MMYCPKCGSEYVEGITECADCGVPLVENPPHLEYEEYEAILSTYNPGDVATLQSVLDHEGVKYYFDGEQFLHTTPFVQPAQLMVVKEDAEYVRELLKNAELNVTGPAHEPAEGHEPSEEEE
ncbi:MAG: hypothetical protein ACLFV4_02275 [Candidatus Hydrogenedentota bacterium]